MDYGVLPPFFFIEAISLNEDLPTVGQGLLLRVGTFYVFLKYAKLYEHERFDKDGLSHLPQGAPELKTPRQRWFRPRLTV